MLQLDQSHDKLLVQKAATPVEARSRNVEEAGKRFSVQRPNAVVQEKSTCEETDVNEQRVSALRSSAEELAEDPGKELHHVHEAAAVQLPDRAKRQRKQQNNTQASRKQVSESHKI